MKHEAIEAISSLVHPSHKWEEPWDNRHNDGDRSDSWTVACSECKAEAQVYPSDHFVRPKIDPVLGRKCIPFSPEDGRLLYLGRQLDELCREYGLSLIHI